MGRAADVGVGPGGEEAEDAGSLVDGARRGWCSAPEPWPRRRTCRPGRRGVRPSSPMASDELPSLLRIEGMHDRLVVPGRERERPCSAEAPSFPSLARARTAGDALQPGEPARVRATTSAFDALVGPLPRIALRAGRPGVRPARRSPFGAGRPLDVPGQLLPAAARAAELQVARARLDAGVDRRGSLAGPDDSPACEPAEAVRPTAVRHPRARCLHPRPQQQQQRDRTPPGRRWPRAAFVPTGAGGEADHVDAEPGERRVRRRRSRSVGPVTGDPSSIAGDVDAVEAVVGCGRRLDRGRRRRPRRRRGRRCRRLSPTSPTPSRLRRRCRRRCFRQTSTIG